jgi:hypothetical protein
MCLSLYKNKGGPEREPISRNAQADAYFRVTQITQSTEHALSLRAILPEPLGGWGSGASGGILLAHLALPLSSAPALC